MRPSIRAGQSTGATQGERVVWDPESEQLPTLRTAGLTQHVCAIVAAPGKMPGQEKHPGIMQSLSLGYGVTPVARIAHSDRPVAQRVCHNPAEWHTGQI